MRGISIYIYTSLTDGFPTNQRARSTTCPGHTGGRKERKERVEDNVQGDVLQRNPAAFRTDDGREQPASSSAITLATER